MAKNDATMFIATFLGAALTMLETPTIKYEKLPDGSPMAKDAFEHCKDCPRNGGCWMQDLSAQNNQVPAIIKVIEACPIKPDILAGKLKVV